MWYSCLAMCNFNPLPSHEGRPTQGRYTGKSSPISIHSPHTRGDILQTASRFSAKFQSTPLTRGETISCRAQRRKKKISIHSPHTRGDVSRRFPNAYLYTYFNPLPSHEGRLKLLGATSERLTFQSTPLTRGETRIGHKSSLPVVFQSTPLTRGETRSGGALSKMRCHFNPLPSHEGRPSALERTDFATYFNPLPSHEGRRARVARIG